MAAVRRRFRRLALMDYEIQRFTRHCAATGRELTPGEEVYSVLIAEGSKTQRLDYSAEAWAGPPRNALGWWRSHVPGKGTRRIGWAPNDVMLEYFEGLADRPEDRDKRFVLALLLVRRRVMRHEETEIDAEGREVMVLYCPRRETTYQVPAAPPSAERTQQIQEELAELLVGGTA